MISSSLLSSSNTIPRVSFDKPVIYKRRTKNRTKDLGFSRPWTRESENDLQSVMAETESSVDQWCTLSYHGNPR